MKALLSLLLWIVCFAGPSLSGEIRTDKAGMFRYILPEGWKVVPGAPAPHDVLLLPGEDGFNRNLVINDQPGTSDFAVLKEKYERDLSKTLKEFKLVSSELVELNNLGKVVRIIHTNTHPGVPVRQINFIVALGGKRYFLACTLPESDGDRNDALVTTFVETLQEK